jgi:hypothetical protein
MLKAETTNEFVKILHQMDVLSAFTTFVLVVSEQQQLWLCRPPFEPSRRHRARWTLCSANAKHTSLQ